MGGQAGGRVSEWVGPAVTYLASDADLCSRTSSLHRQLIILPRPPARLPASLAARSPGRRPSTAACLPPCCAARPRCRWHCSGSPRWRSSGKQARRHLLHPLFLGCCGCCCPVQGILRSTGCCMLRLPLFIPAPFPFLCSLLAPVQPGDRPLCVLNTHLFFHYMAPHIRTMHVWAMVQASAAAGLCGWLGWAAEPAVAADTCLDGLPCAQLSMHGSCGVQEAQEFIEAALADAELAGALSGQRPTLLFCGDLNSGGGDLESGLAGVQRGMASVCVHACTAQMPAAPAWLCALPIRQHSAQL